VPKNQLSLVNLRAYLQLILYIDYWKTRYLCLVHLEHVYPKLSLLRHQLTERQLGNEINSSFRFTNVRHIKSTLSQLTDDHAFSLAELPLVRFVINCCHSNTNRLSTCRSISQYNVIWKGVSGRVCIESEAYQAVIYDKKGDTVTARWRGKLTVEEFNAGHCWILFDWALTACQIHVKLTVR